MSILLFLLLFFAPGSRSTPQRPAEIHVAAAADLRFAMDTLVQQYERDAGTHVAVTYGASGNFFAQIQNGAPFDLFFSADTEYPRQLAERGLTAPDSLREYATGRLVLWAPEDSKLRLKERGWAALSDASVRKIAIANPAIAPYGRGAVAAMQSVGEYAQLRERLVYGENVLQAAQFVESGNAQAAILPLSLALAPEMSRGQRWEVPASLYPAIRQSAAVLRDAKNPRAAHAFLDFVLSGAGQTILEHAGFGPPV
jgi:molybdate transport system substrate-binding protein